MASSPHNLHSLSTATELLSCRRKKDGSWAYGNFEVSNTWKDIVPASWELMEKVPAYGAFWDGLLAANFPKDDMPEGAFLIELEVEYRAINGSDEEVLEVLMELNDMAKTPLDKRIEEVTNESVGEVLKNTFGEHKFFGRVTSERGDNTLIRWFVVRDMRIKEMSL